MSVEQRLASLGYPLPNVATPVGNYVPARRLGNVVYTSGQLPVVEGSLAAQGTVGNRAHDVTPERASECARIAVVNGLAAVAAVAGGLDNISGVVRMTGYIAATPDFADHPGVLNAASLLLAETFGESGRHARSVVGVASLPLGSPVEIELILELKDS